MKKGWENKLLNNMSVIMYGHTAKSSSDKTGPKYLRITDIQNSSVDWTSVPHCDNLEDDTSKYKLHDGDLVFARTGATTGKSFLIQNAPLSVFASYLIRVQADQREVSPEYLYKYFQSYSYWSDIRLGTSGSAQGGFNAKKLGALSIPIPPLSEQEEIVEVLDKAFAAIDQAKANIEQNIANAKELFQSKLNQIFSQKGEGWVETTLGDVCDKITDGAHHSPKTLYAEKAPSLFPYITSKNIRNNFMDFSKLQYVDEEFHRPNFARCAPALGDVLLTKDGANTGNITTNTLDEPFSLLSSVALIKTNRKKLDSSFLKFYVQSPIGFKSITGKMTGAAIKRIILRNIKTAKILIPEVELQKSFVSSIEELLVNTERIQKTYSQKLASLDELKKSILQKAFAGKLT